MKLGKATLGHVAITKLATSCPQALRAVRLLAGLAVVASAAGVGLEADANAITDFQLPDIGAHLGDVANDLVARNVEAVQWLKPALDGNDISVAQTTICNLK